MIDNSSVGRFIVLWGYLTVFFMVRGANLLAQYNDLEIELANMISSHPSNYAHWAISVRDTLGKELISYQSDKFMVPASNLKLISSFAILDALSPHYTFKTALYGLGKQLDSVWYGDLLIVGSGDPSINGHLYNDDPLFMFRNWCSILVDRGINTVMGSVIGDDLLFDRKAYPKGWLWNDLSFYYAAEVGALSFNNNTVELTVEAKGRVGTSPSIDWFPWRTDYVNFVNQQQITLSDEPYKEDYHKVLGTNSFILSSTLPKGHIEEEALAITDPTLYFLDVFGDYLEQQGISVKEGYQRLISGKELIPKDRWLKLAEHESNPLYVLLEEVNKKSSNFYTEMLLKAAAYSIYGVQGTTDLGIKLIHIFANRWGIPHDRLIIHEGSGMSDGTYIRPTDLSLFLVQSRKHKFFDYFFRSLSIAGVSGSLEERFVASSLRNRFYGKSGFKSGVRTLSGYLETQSGNLIAVSLMTNHYHISTSSIDFLHARLLEILFDNL